MEVLKKACFRKSRCCGLASATHWALELVIEEGAFSAPAFDTAYGHFIYWEFAKLSLAGNSV